MNPILIYHFQTSQNSEGDFKPARYKVVYFFSDEGFFEKGQLQELAKSVPDSRHTELTFLSLDDLRSFALRVAQEFQTSEVRLLSVQDYNIGIDGAKDLMGFKTIFSQYGESVVNEEAKKKKGFLGKFFS